MFKFLEKLRALPEGSRKMVVLFSSTFLTIVLLVSWLVFPVPHFGRLSDAEKERKSAENLVAPFSIIGGEIGQATGEIKDKWESLGGTAGIWSAVSSLQENTATSTATSTAEAGQGEDVISEQESFLGDSAASSSAPEATATPEKESVTSTSSTAEKTLYP